MLRSPSLAHPTESPLPTQSGGSRAIRPAPPRITAWLKRSDHEPIILPTGDRHPGRSHRNAQFYAATAGCTRSFIWVRLPRPGLKPRFSFRLS